MVAINDGARDIKKENGTKSTSVSNTIYNDISSIRKANSISVYKGTFVIFTELPFDRSAFSFGVIVMDNYYADVPADSFMDTLNHEYGHFVHFQMIGPATYLTTTAIPSLVFAGLSLVSPTISDNYYNLPWERVADYLGGVNRGYAPGANAAGLMFLLWTLLVDYATP